MQISRISDCVINPALKENGFTDVNIDLESKMVDVELNGKSEEEVRAMNPDYFLVLPWHFISEFTQRETEFLNKGGKLIVPCPKFEIIGKDGY